MLILTRRINESLVIGEGPDAVTVTVLGIHGRQCKIGIDAPRSVNIRRDELEPRERAEARA